jgi:hypothetical protein
MIVAGGRTRPAPRSRRPTPAAHGFHHPNMARPAGHSEAIPGPAYEKAPRPLVTARYRDLRVVLTRDHERP